MKPIGILLALILILTGCKLLVSKETKMKIVYRINCGSMNGYIDTTGQLWEADCCFTGGLTAVREKTLSIHHTAAPEVYRTERYNMERYRFPVENGTYAVRLHFAEEFDCNYTAGARSFGVQINGKEIVKDFDPYRAAGGFACPAIIEYAGCAVTNSRIEITFTGKAAINGIEIYKTTADVPVKIQQLSKPLAASETFIGTRLEAAPDARTLKILFIGNSYTFFWAIPESLQAMLETGTRDLRIEPVRSLYGGKNLAFHFNETDALKLIAIGRFDYVVIQPDSNEQLEKIKQLFEYAEKFDAAIKASGAKTLLYAQPMRLKTTDAERRQIIKNMAALGEKLGAPVIPVCETLRRCYEKRPDLTWHNADTVHMGMHGGYAVACTFYAALTGSTNFPPPAVLVQQAAMDPAIAAFIQQHAVEAVREYTHPLPAVGK